MHARTHSWPTRPLLTLALLGACGDSQVADTSSALDEANATTNSSSTTAVTTSASSTSEAGASTTTSETSTTGETSETGDATELTECPEIATPTAIATVALPELTETSGLVASRDQPDILWAHNDSGDAARLFAINTAGQARGTFTLAGVSAIDWEDMAIGPGPNLDDAADWLYLADIGDNLRSRESITIYRVPEPSADGVGGELSGAHALSFTYPDEPHDAETLLLDPRTGDLLIVTKGLETQLFSASAPLNADEAQVLVEHDIEFPSMVTTAGDSSPLGDFIIVRTYVDAHLWLRGPAQTMAAAMNTAPCSVVLKPEPQGETIAIAADGRGYFTLSEMANQPLWSYTFVE